MICVFTKNEMLDTMFVIFDEDQSGNIERDEFRKVVSAIGKNANNGNFPTNFSDIQQRVGPHSTLVTPRAC